jgi:hypothetical protein
MTTHYEKTCKHCGTPYSFQGSGEWEGDYNQKLNDDSFCPTCKEAILQALSSIPKKFEWRFVESKAYTVKELIKMALRQDAEYFCKNIGVPVKRVFPQLIEKPGDNRYMTEEVNTTTGVFRVSYWTGEELPSHPNCVKKKVLWDLMNNREHQG